MRTPSHGVTFPWERLLGYIEGGHIVPVVGPELLSIHGPNGSTLFYAELAQRLLSEFGIPADAAPGASLNEAACLCLSEGAAWQDIYLTLNAVLPNLVRDLSPPEPLMQLAEIRSLNLFISTTFDPLLEKALNAVRFDGRPLTRSVVYSPDNVRDLPMGFKDLDGPVVYYLFGRISAVPDYAVTEEDTLEFIHSLQSDTRRPRLLFEALAKQHLMVLGSNLPDWLTRFFIRFSSRERLWLVRDKTNVLAGDLSRGEPKLAAFLSHFSKDTRIYPDGDAVQFVNHLHTRWLERSGGRAGHAAATRDGKSTGPTMPDGAIFISYANEDLAAAKALRDALEAARLDVWLDKRQLHAGDRYEEKIRGSIERASVFLPVLSRSCLTEERRFFRLEWEHADRVSRMAHASARFIVPVAIDDIEAGDVRLPDYLRRVHWNRWDGGTPSQEFLNTVTKLFRTFQSHRQSRGEEA